MRRLITFTALVMALLISCSLQAQRGVMGGGRSFGGGSHVSPGFRSAPSRGFAAPSRGFAPAPRGFISGPRVYSTVPRSFAPRTFAPRTFGPRTFPPRSTVTVRSFSPARHGSFAPFPVGFNHFHNHNHFFFHHGHFFHGCFGCFSPFFFSGGFFFGDPFFFGSPAYYGYPGYYAPPAPAPEYVSSDNTDSSSNAALAMQVQNLSDEVADLREEARDRERAEKRAAEPNQSLTAKEPGLPVEFIFRDGRHITAQNYAIAGQTLWILDEHAARKFALSDLDVDATQQINAGKGIDLHIPAVQPR